MKKKLAATLAALMIAGMLAGCGDSTSTNIEVKEETTSSTTVETELITTTTSSTTATETTAKITTSENTTKIVTAIVETYPEIYEFPFYFNHGNMAFSSNGIDYVYNIVKNEIFSLYEYETFNYALGDVIVINAEDSIAGFSSKNAYLYNVETKVQLLSAEEDGIIPYYDYIFGDNPQNILVAKLEDSFSGNKISFGMINSKGEWAYQLSDNLFTLTKDIYTAQELETASYDVFGDSILINDEYIYCFKTNTLSPFDNYLQYKNDSKIFSTSKDKKQIFCHDGNTGENIKLYESDEPIYWFQTSNCIVVIDKRVILIDKNNYHELEFDITEYDVNDIIEVCDDKIAFTAYNPDEENYLILMNNDGSFIVDPIKLYSLHRGAITFNDNLIICDASYTGNSFILNCDTGELIRNKDIYYEMLSYDETSETMLVETDGIYYLVDPKDPYTLINPFEKADH